MVSFTYMHTPPWIPSLLSLRIRLYPGACALRCHEYSPVAKSQLDTRGHRSLVGQPPVLRRF